MRRILATVLSAAVMLSTVAAAIGSVVGAEGGNKSFTRVTFDGASAAFYEKSTQTNASYEDTKDSSHGKAIKFTQLSSYWTNKWPQALRIGNTDGSGAFMLEKGAKYKISFDYKKERLTGDVNMLAAITDAGNGIGNLGTMGSWNEAGKGVYIGWIGRGNSNSWGTFSGTFTAAADGTLAMSAMTYDMGDLKYQKLWVDNVAVEKVVDYSGDTVEVTRDYKDGKAPEKAELYAGHSYGHPTREGYIFGGWFTDAECTVSAPATVRSDCTYVYAKWTADTRVPQSIVNTYDDEGITYTVKDNMTDFNSAVSNWVDFTSAGAEVVKTDDGTGAETNALHFKSAAKYDWQWPSIARIYDNGTKNAKFTPNADSAYEISLKYRADKKPSQPLLLQIERVGAGVRNPNGKWSSNNIYLIDLARIDDVTDGWVTAKARFYTESETPITITCVSENTNYSADDVDIYVDDITLNERLDVRGIYFETNGGNELAAINCIAKTEIPVFNPPTREGYLFDGWYTDAKLTQPFDCGIMPDSQLTLYAAWVKKETEAKSFYSGFESGEYAEAPYKNTGAAAAVSDNAMSSSALWHENDANEAYDGSGYITFDDGIENLTGESSSRWMAISLYNKDGTPFQIIEGKRYKISLAYRHWGAATNKSTKIKLLASEQAPGVGINSGNSTAILDISALGPDKHETQTWGEYSTYVIAAASGPLKLAVCGDSPDHIVDVDNLEIKLLDETRCIKVEYIQQKPDGSGQASAGVRLGAPGALLIAGDSAKYEGYSFNGWRDKDGKLFTGNTFPKSDITLYASWREADDISKATTDWSKDVIIDFEDTDKAKAFYEDSKNCYHPSNGVFVMENDPENAHSGNNYFRYYQCGHWMEQYLRGMKLYDPNTAGNQVYLAPNSVYKVSFWLNIEDVGAGNLYLAVFPNKDNLTDWTVANENYITDTNQFENFGKWVLYENTVVTGDDEDGDGVAGTLGFVLYGGYLTAKLDDITITKLREINVTFDSNGGSEVNGITQLSHDYIIAPADPEREGYTFTGWYSDKALKNKFDFTGTLVNQDMTLYAGWEKIVTPEPVYKTVTSYTDVAEEVEVEPNDPELDGKITVNENDKIGKISSSANNKSPKAEKEDNSLIWIIIAISGAAVLAAGAVITVIAVKKRKNKV